MNTTCSFSIAVLSSCIWLVPVACGFQTNNQPASQPTGSESRADATKQDDSAWETFAPTGAWASFEMPQKPRLVERSFPTVEDKPPTKVHLHLATVNQGNTTFLFGYHDLHELPPDQATIDKALNGAIQGSVYNVSGQMLGDPTKITFKKTYPGRQFLYMYKQDDKRFVVTARVFLVDKRQYQISCLMSESTFDESLAAKFINSFRIIEPDYDLPPRPRVKK